MCADISVVDIIPDEALGTLSPGRIDVEPVYGISKSDVAIEGGDPVPPQNVLIETLYLVLKK
jgi:hypothetical protein